MYIPKHFEETRPGTLHALMQAQPLATLVVHGPQGLDANHIPLHLSADAGEHGTLRGHISRANPLAALDGAEVLAVFHGPDAYVTPSWYPTKAESGKAVPTWNYAVVHAHGRLRIVEDAGWLRSHLETLTDSQEAGLPTPWQVADAPADYIAKMAAAIVGIEIEITRLAGKWKVSQNQPDANRAGVVAGLQTLPHGGDMAQLVDNARTPH